MDSPLRRAAQIAWELGVSEATVKAHMTAIMRKLGVGNRTQVALLASELAVEPPDRMPAPRAGLFSRSIAMEVSSFIKFHVPSAHQNGRSPSSSISVKPVGRAAPLSASFLASPK